MALLDTKAPMDPTMNFKEITYDIESLEQLRFDPSCSRQCQNKMLGLRDCGGQTNQVT